MSYRYTPAEIEPKWQTVWEEQGLYKTREDAKKPKWYALTMLPYPSGDLHTGHWYAYTPSDAGARFRRMNGYNVFFPIGFDAFGLPAENAAIRNGAHPAKWTFANIERMRGQLRRMGAMWAWEHEAVSCDPEYYKWSQWFFRKFYDAGIAYREYSPVDWCPNCNTTLAREQVWGEDRHCERCGTPVIKKNLEQWKFSITKYADELLDGLDKIEWPERVKVMQTNWIGRSIGAEVVFKTEQGDALEIFTTRPDTLWGATFMVLAPEHPLVDTITTADRRAEVDAYKAEAARMDEIARSAKDKEKTGVFTGGYAQHPITGADVPVWVADYVLNTYGSGAIMAVPAHDTRDWEFAKTFGIPIVEVIQAPAEHLEGPYCGAGRAINSPWIDGKVGQEAIDEMIARLESSGVGNGKTTYRLRDWIFSRQRYWGEPFPIVHTEDGGKVLLPDSQLPIRLPAMEDFGPSGNPEPPLAKAKEWVEVELPDGRTGKRETNTMPNWAGSCWYYLRFLDPKNPQAAWSKEKEQYWMPVDLYVGGREHAVLHLLYARFWHKVLFDRGYVTHPEPFGKLFHQGLILSFSYEDVATKVLVPFGAKVDLVLKGRDAMLAWGHI